MLLAVAVGIAAGLAEAGLAVLEHTVGRQATGAIVWGEVYWMAPAAACALFVLLALLLVGLRRLLRVEAPAGLAPALFVLVAVYGLGRSLALGIDPRALVVLAGGIAAVATRGIALRTPAVLRWTRRFAAIGVAGLLVWAAWVPRARSLHWREAARSLPAPAVEGPNVLLIVWDTVRAASLSLYGYGRETTPNLERLAGEAVVFERAVAPSSWTLPSHASLFTARYPHEHGADREAPLDDTFPTLAEALSARGYETAGFVANLYWLGDRFGLSRGFQRWEDEWWSPTPEQILGSWWVTRQAYARLRARARIPRAPVRVRADRVQDAFLDWVNRRDRERPFFAFLNLFDAHEPYELPTEYRFAAPDARFWWDYRAPEVLPEEDLADLRDTYDSCLFYLDRQLGRLMDRLAERGLLDNTLVILTADHGESLGEHGPAVLGHSSSSYYDVLHVPLVVRLPGGAVTERRHESVSLVDVPTTVMEVVDGPGAGHPFPGHSLLSRSGGGSASAAPAAHSPAFSHSTPADFHLPHDVWPISKGPLLSLVEDGRHYLRNALGEEALFDVDADYWERDDLSLTPGATAVLSELHARVDALSDASRSAESMTPSTVSSELPASPPRR